MKNENINKDIAYVDDFLAKKYKDIFSCNVNDVCCPVDNRASMWLQNDIAVILCNASDIETTKKTIIDTIKGINSDVLGYINFEKACNEAIIKKDWKKAFSKVKCGSDLSSDIGWSFSDKDISNLAKLYKTANKKLKEKIEDLLTDCNFHTECGDFASGRLDKYIKGAA